MNFREIALEELELHHAFLEESLNCIIHTILFVRAPGRVKPQDIHCKLLAPLSYPKCVEMDVDDSVQTAITKFESSIAENVGPTNRRGTISIAFYEKREQKGFFGLINTEAKRIFERWKITVLINEETLKRSDDETYLIAKQRIYDDCRNTVEKILMSIFEAVNATMDHVPPSMYEYEFQFAGDVKGGSSTSTTPNFFWI